MLCGPVASWSVVCSSWMCWNSPHVNARNVTSTPLIVSVNHWGGISGSGIR